MSNPELEQLKLRYEKTLSYLRRRKDEYLFPFGGYHWKELGALEAELAKIGAEIQSMERQMRDSDLERENEDLKEEIHRLEGNNESLEREINRLEALVEEKERELGFVKTEIEAGRPVFAPPSHMSQGPAGTKSILRVLESLEALGPGWHTVSHVCELMGSGEDTVRVLSTLFSLASDGVISAAQVTLFRCLEEGTGDSVV